MSPEIKSAAIAITQYLVNLILFYIFANRTIRGSWSWSMGVDLILALASLILAGFYYGPKALEQLLELLK